MNAGKQMTTVDEKGYTEVQKRRQYEQLSEEGSFEQPRMRDLYRRPWSMEGPCREESTNVT